MNITFHPAAERPAAAAGLAFFLGLAGAVLMQMLTPVVALVLCLALAGSVAAFFVPTVYEFGDETITVRRWGADQSYAWSRFRSFEQDKNGVFLSPYRRPHRLDRLRGVFLPMDRARRHQLRPLLEARLVER
ncbi:MAG: hypothetical protein KC910_06905 [Candidatus Eremiobacteraeota bacterium]|nr:hypothetical protein [Candidatus Eremiobacteraeota bacterium]